MKVIQLIVLMCGLVQYAVKRYCSFVWAQNLRQDVYYKSGVIIALEKR